MEPNQRQLYDAALSGDTKPLPSLLLEDPLMLHRCIIEKSSAYTQSPLHVAADEGHVEFTKELLRRKPELAEVVHQVKMWSPLHAASANGHSEIIEALIRAKPRMCFAYDRDGMTPIHIAVVNKQLQVFLRKQPLAVREPTTHGETVLHLCVKTNQLNFVRFLLEIIDENGDLLNSLDSNGNINLPPLTPQHTQETEISLTTHQVDGNVMNGPRQDNNGGDSLASMCLVRNQDGRNPIHVAAANGLIDVLQVLHRANPCAAQERTNNGESVLHLCVKHSQLNALITLINLHDNDGDQLINSKDNNGNTILHLAVTCKQREMVEYLLAQCKSRIEINAVNNKDMTVVDLYQKQSKKDERDREIKKYLKRAKAKRGKDTLLDHQAERLENQRSALMVVASLIATMAFQAGVNPPGGVYPDTEKGDHEAGFAIWPYYYKDNMYNVALISNTIGFVSSMTVIAVLISGLPFEKDYLITMLRVTLWIAVVATSTTYSVVLRHVTRADDPPLLATIVVSYLIWIYVMVFILLANIFGFFWRRRNSIIAYFKSCFAPRRNANHSNNNSVSLEERQAGRPVNANA